MIDNLLLCEVFDFPRVELVSLVRHVCHVVLSHEIQPMIDHEKYTSALIQNSDVVFDFIYILIFQTVSRVFSDLICHYIGDQGSHTTHAKKNSRIFEGAKGAMKIQLLLYYMELIYMILIVGEWLPLSI